MQLTKNTLRSVLLSLAAIASPAMANNCGDIPQAPELVDGAKVTMDELVANSKSVKDYIAAADVYLTCNETFAKSDDFKSLEAAEQKKVLDINSTLLDSRNNIGEKFNAEVTAYKAANPK